MRSPVALARRSQALRATDFSNICWTCLLAQRRQLSNTSPARARARPRAVRYHLTNAPPKLRIEAGEVPPATKRPSQKPATSLHPTIKDYHKDEERLLAQLLDQHRCQARRQQDAIDRIAHLSPGNAPASKRSFHTSSRLRQEAAARSVPTPQDLAAIIPDKPATLTTRQYLQQWQERYGSPNQELLDELGIEAYGSRSENLARLDTPSDLRDVEVRDEDAENRGTAAFLDPADTVDEEVGDRALQTGDLVEISFVGEREPLIAVFIAQYGTQGQFYSMQGQWFHRKLRQVQFAVPKFIDRDLLQPIIPYLPKGEVTEELLDTMQTLDVNAPREIAAPVLNKLKEFAEEADIAYRQNASILDQAHEKLAHPTDLRFGTLHRIANTLLKAEEKVSITTKYAVRKALLRQPLGFNTDNRSHRLTGVYQILPIQFKKQIQLAVEWVRSFQDHLACRAAQEKDGSGAEVGKSHEAAELKKQDKEPDGAAKVWMFVLKCQKLIDLSRTMRDFTPHGRVGISKTHYEINESTTAMQDFYDVQFDKADAVLIRFIEAWSISALFHHNTRLGALPPIILRALGRYPEQELDFVTGYTFLQEIGVIPPHENRTKYDPHLLLPTASHSRQLEDMYTRIVKMGSTRERLKLHDAMEGHRTDWGSLPMFCVDSASAEEIDDGVSVERIPGSSDCWVHVHIANPTAFLPKEHLISKMAAHLTESIYMPERTYSMLPKWIADERLSLDNDRPCLTISTRLDEQGKVVDNKIQSGFIRNYVPLTPQTLHFVVDERAARAAEANPDKIYVVGGKVPSLPQRKMTEVDELTEDQKADLRLLHKLALARQERRTEAGGIFWNQNYPEMSVYHHHEHAGLPWSHPSREIARFTKGDPVIQMVATPTESWFQPAGTGSDLMVREMMLLAGETGALWCRQRRIPSIYRGTVARPGMMPIDEYREKYILPTLDERGNPPAKIAFNYLPHAGSSVTSLRPIAHQVLGVQQYVKLTSPLRRYGDMIMHWQIESALRQEAELGKSLASPEMMERRRRRVAFSPDEISVIMARLAPRERLISKTKRASQGFWLTQLFFRAFYYGEASIPDTFEVVVFSPATDLGRVSVLWQDLSFDLDMELPQDQTPEIGDRWEVRISEIDTYNRRVKTVPLRLISREVLPDWVGDLER
ncbi:rnb-domain-containing protein [Diplodia corticola]|uniref:Rnb-domain-containing protein n=1 Tax=Diplodia corticola TaxID=236234 RepID=A0A1J9SL83_9PEZI|nr:rnb-domain-containing protein [Diplodia corticola]OJD40476.1 rnb-domain-containing protein [Diplodia corticola]